MSIKCNAKTKNDFNARNNYINNHNITINVNSLIRSIPENINTEERPTGAGRQFFNVTGTSTLSNATHTKCNVQLQTNQHGFKPVIPLGPAGTYTNWKGATSEPVKVGQNQVEGQFQCFAPNTTTPNFTKHLVRNFTGIQTNLGIQVVPTIPH